MIQPWEQITEALQPLRRSLLEHPVYEQVRDVTGMRRFMEYHVFAVWDFMSLLKELQRKLCCIDVPWLPPRYPQAARLINEIVLAEETDETEDGQFASHFDLYFRAMDACGANTAAINRFLDELKAGAPISAALVAAQTPPAVQSFVEQTFAVIKSESLPAVAATFTYGREDLLPDLFERIVLQINSTSAGSLKPFLYYLDRHVSLDKVEHGPMAIQLMSLVCGDNADCWHEAEQAAVAALNARLNLWDAMSVAINSLSAP